MEQYFTVTTHITVLNYSMSPLVNVIYELNIADCYGLGYIEVEGSD
jgi:hypothetical protein